MLVRRDAVTIPEHRVFGGNRCDSRTLHFLLKSVSLESPRSLTGVSPEGASVFVIPVSRLPCIMVSSIHRFMHGGAAFVWPAFNTVPDKDCP